MTDDDRTRGIPLTPHTNPIPLRKPEPEPRADQAGAVIPAAGTAQPPQGYPPPGYQGQGHPAPGYPPPPYQGQAYPVQGPPPGYQQYPAQGYAPPIRYAPPQHPTYGSTTIVTRPAPNTAVIVIAWIIALFTAFYMLPWAIAATRGKSNQLAIGLVNLLLGWSGIGWVVALVMACSAEPTPTVMIQQNHYGNGPYPG